MPIPLRLIFIGASRSEAIEAELRRGDYEPVVEQITSRAQLDNALVKGWDLVISDFADLDFSALQALSIIQDKGVDLPVIVITGKIRDEEVISLLKAGAADHLMRNNLMRLNAAVERELRAAAQRRERVRLEEQFRQAQKMEAVGRLAGGVAHDFNNLLTIITGYSDLLLSKSDVPPPYRSALEEIRRSAERGGALTNQLLAFSRRQPLQPHLIHLNELVLQIEKMLRRLIGEDIELVTIPAASNDSIDADPGRLEQVIMNLAVNARDAMPNGGKLTIETGTVQLGASFSAKQLGVKPGTYITLSVVDTGTGMNEETKSHLFEPFFTTKNPGRGTGLGLATAYGIIRQSGGAIGIYSELGVGTTARIYLPQASSDAATQQAAALPEAELGGFETILLVEDEARVRKLILDVLTARGYKVLEATRGEEALRLCELYKNDIPLSVVDVVMPEMSGPDLMRKISPLHPEMRVLYISGYTDEAIIHHGILRSGAAFLQKPFMPDALVRKVREVLDSRSNSAPKP
ncbi:MAG: hybrid sensor histidine kinase/response regulator [Terriglobia bacterium]|nr:MAG: hybrid sensor histidine kinase/response regulator [Terriglobia bacterium]